MEHVLNEHLTDREDIHVAVGMDVGKVIVSRLGKQGERITICFGPEVTEAERLQTISSAKQIRICGEIYDQLDDEEVKEEFTKRGSAYVATNLTFPMLDEKKEEKAAEAGSLGANASDGRIRVSTAATASAARQQAVEVGVRRCAGMTPTQIAGSRNRPLPPNCLTISRQELTAPGRRTSVGRSTSIRSTDTFTNRQRCASSIPRRFRPETSHPPFIWKATEIGGRTRATVTLRVTGGFACLFLANPGSPFRTRPLSTTCSPLSTLSCSSSTSTRNGWPRRSSQAALPSGPVKIAHTANRESEKRYEQWAALAEMPLALVGVA
ncbi:MAG: hypothetical protein H6823_27290 [Planctomycetaceae bacterium]|nr:hypothetical protein [Planctomycetaceae bacterium]